MRARSLVIAYVLLVSPVPGWPAAEVPVAKRTLLGTEEEFCEEPRTVWWGRDREVPFSRLAHSRAAPVLWFSPDEPLIRGQDKKVPQPIQCGNRDPRGTQGGQLTRPLPEKEQVQTAGAARRSYMQPMGKEAK